MEGWVDLGYPAMQRPGVKLATSESQVRRPNHYTTEPPNRDNERNQETSCSHSTVSVAVCTYLQVVIHRVPKLATPLTSNMLNSVWSSWISTKYRTLHYLNISYCHAYYEVRTLSCVLNVTSLWHQSSQTVWNELDQRTINKTIKQAVVHPPKSLRRAQTD